jgi:hypothetical protein
MHKKIVGGPEDIGVARKPVHIRLASFYFICKSGDVIQELEDGVFRNCIPEMLAVHKAIQTLHDDAKKRLGIFIKRRVISINSVRVCGLAFHI